jgi:hypothetical protein
MTRFVTAVVIQASAVESKPMIKGAVSGAEFWPLDFPDTVERGP